MDAACSWSCTTSRARRAIAITWYCCMETARARRGPRRNCCRREGWSACTATASIACTAPTARSGCRRWGRDAPLHERVFVGGLHRRLLLADHAATHEVLQTLIEGLHADVLAGLDRRIHLRNFCLADQVANGGRADHDLVRGRAAAAALNQVGLRAPDA